MKCNENTRFMCAVAVAVACMEDERPKNQDVNPMQAADYMQHVLDILFSASEFTPKVETMTYPRCSKIPLIIRIGGLGACLFWYYPNQSAGEIAGDLEDVLEDFLCENARVSA